jgi:hypothetical protein
MADVACPAMGLQNGNATEGSVALATVWDTEQAYLFWLRKSTQNPDGEVP